MKTIKDFPMYSITEDGDVYSHYKNIFLKQAINKGGYLYVCLTNSNKKQYVKKIHRLIAENYLGPQPLDKPWALHKDGNRLNCNVSNIYWGTASENQFDRVTHGMNHLANKTHCVRGHILKEPNLTKSLKNINRRGCLSCSRAMSYAKNHPEHSIKYWADNKYYPKIMNELSD